MYVKRFVGAMMMLACVCVYIFYILSYQKIKNK
jgi:hypothetical protein